LIAAADPRTALALGRAGLGDRCYLLPSDAQREAPPGGGRIGYYWGSSEWVAATWRKVVALASLMEAHPVDVLVSDVDVVWLDDPLPFMAAHPAASLLASLDTPGSWTPPGDAGLEHDFQLGRVANTGVLLARHQPGGGRGVGGGARSGGGVGSRVGERARGGWRAGAAEGAPGGARPAHAPLAGGEAS
jgi:hypothetical protein